MLKTYLVQWIIVEHNIIRSNIMTEKNIVIFKILWFRFHKW